MIKFQKDDIPFYCAYISYFKLSATNTAPQPLHERFSLIDRKIFAAGVRCEANPTPQGLDFIFSKAERKIATVPYRQYKDNFEALCKQISTMPLKFT